MFNIFNTNLRPMMDELDSGSGGVATSQATTSTESTTDTSTTSTESAASTGNQSEGTTGVTGEVDTKAKQTPEQDRAYAELRRSKEAAEKRAIEVESLRKRDQEIARKYGKEYGIYSDEDVAAQYGQSHGIKTVAEFEAALEKEAQEAAYKANGINPELVKQIVNQDPEFRAMKEQFSQQQGQAVINAEIKELSDEYPDLKVKTLADMQELPNFEAIKAKAYKGMTLLEAYESVNRAEIRKKQADAAKQATLNSIQGKGHLQGNGKGSEVDTTTIPDDVLDMYKRFNPGKTMDEYKAHYKKSL